MTSEREGGRAMPRLVLQFFPILVTMALVLGITACGSAANVTGGFSTDVAATKVAVQTDPSGALRWDKPAYETTAGDVTFVVTNTSGQGHDFSVQGNGINVTSGTFRDNTPHNFTIKGLNAGTYVIVCTIPGHKESGMIAKLTVK
jgi:uncharacterized cupredoxin-like copper-binding protein